MTLKHKNFTIFPLILREIDAEKTQKMTFSQDYRIKNFEVIYEEQMIAPIQNHTKYYFETKISTFFLLSSEKSMRRKRRK
jgi:hypothetical protein